MLLQRLLRNVLGRHYAHARGCTELDYYSELDLWSPRAPPSTRPSAGGAHRGHTTRGGDASASGEESSAASDGSSSSSSSSVEAEEEEEEGDGLQGGQ